MVFDSIVKIIVNVIFIVIKKMMELVISRFILCIFLVIGSSSWLIMFSMSENCKMLWFLKCCDRNGMDRFLMMEIKLIFRKIGVNLG